MALPKSKGVLDIKSNGNQKSDGPLASPDFSPAGFFVFRTPLLPLSEFINWSDGLVAPSTLDNHLQLEEALEQDRALLRDRLLEIVQKPIVRDAIFVASPNIIERFHFWTDNRDSERGRKIENVLVRYFSRMTGRATPFGLFAGCSVGNTAERTRLAIDGLDSYQRHTRLDMDYLFALTNALTRDPELRSCFLYHPNSSLYRAAGRVRYVESRLEDKFRSYHLVALDENDHLDRILAVAKPGATFSQLKEALVDDEISSTEAEEYLTQLIDNQVLVPDICLPVTGPESVYPLVDQLDSHQQTSATAAALGEATASLKKIDQAGLGVAPERYHAVAGMLETLPSKPELNRLFQVDMVKPAHDATLGSEVLSEIIRGVNLLHGLTQSERLTHKSLARFRERFVDRYEQSEIPLVEALDEEIGIGFDTSNESSPLLKDLAFPEAPDEKSVEPNRYRVLLRKLSEALQAGVDEITFDVAELEGISSKDRRPLPNSFCVMARLSAKSQASLDQGDFRVLLESAIGPSGANLMGRFCHADQKLLTNVRSLLRDEEALDPEVEFAEIVHLPEGRVGNVIARPVLRAIEIPYLGRSGLPPENQLPVNDLYVSVQGSRVRLRSMRTGREVIPRMTTAHNYSTRSLGLYKFLCMLQHQEVTECSWDWGAVSAAPFLPRVRIGRLVLCLARWHLTKEDLRSLAQANVTDRFRAVQRLRLAKKLPRLICLADDDNQLSVDLDNVLSVESFVQLVKEREQTTLRELFADPDNLCAFGPEGAFVHELIVPFTKVDNRPGPNTHTPLPAPQASVCPRARHFPPGSEWVYAKIYAGTATADTILKDAIRPLTESLLRSEAVDQWFFIRYSDPESHLRLRFHNLPDILHQRRRSAVEQVLNQLVYDGLVWRVQFDTYEREIERYGGIEGILLAEKLFHFDSEAVLEIIEMLEPGDEGADERWRLAVKGIDSLLSDFGFDVEMKRRLVKEARESFGKEYRVDGTLLGQLSEKYRRERKSLENLLNPDCEKESSLSPGLEVFRRRTEHLAPVVVELRRLDALGRLSRPLPELVSSFVHMHVNRLIRSAQRQNELVLYDFLARLYEAVIARNKA